MIKQAVLTRGRGMPRLVLLVAVVLSLLVSVLVAQQSEAFGSASNCAAADNRGKAPTNPRSANCDAVSMQFLWVSDWHAQIDPISVSGVPIGGAAAISTYWQQDRAAFDGTSITLTAGDAYGAAPPLSSLFDEVPGVLAQRLMGFDFDTFGNHNFDRGIAHLQQMIDLAGAPTGADAPGTPFRYVAANLANRDDNLSGVADYAIVDVGGVKVAIIGLVNEEAPNLVFPGNFGTIEVTDAVKAANRARAAARRDGAKVFVVITHKGVTGTHDGMPTGPLIDFANAVKGFHIIFGDHTDWLFEGVINDQLVLENRSKGLTYGRTNLTVDRRNGTVVARSNEFVTPTATAVTPDPAVVEALAPYRVALAQAFDQPIAVATDTFVRGGNIERRQEVAIGNLVTDAMRLTFGTQLGFTNAGGIRASLPSTYLPTDTTLRRPPAAYAAGPPWDLVIGDVFEVLPFGNNVVEREVTGAQLWAMLENGVSQIQADGSSTDGRFPQISGFRFSYRSDVPAGSRVQTVELDDGTPILPDATRYTMVTNDFVNTGGDFYTMLADGHGHVRDVMFNVVLDYIRNQGTITPMTEGRITRLN